MNTLLLLNKAKVFIFVITLTLHFNTFCQENVLSFKNENLSQRVKKDSYTLTNTLNNDLAIVIVERKKVMASLFDAEFNQKVSLETDDLKNKYNEVIGYSIDGLKYEVLYSNDKKNKFAILTIDFETKTMNTSEIEIDMEDAIYLDVVNYKNNLYLFTASDDLKLNILAYDKNLSFKVVKTFTLDDVENKSLLLQSKYRLGTFMLSGSKASGVTKVDQRAPNSIDNTSSPSKLYQLDNKVYLTFDGDGKGTSVYDIDLKTLSIDFKSFNYPTGKLGEFKKFNSFIYDDKIFQIASSNAELSFIVKTLSGEVVKEFYIEENLPITFKNSPIIQEGMTAIPFVSKRELEETKKFLRKITQADLGVTVLKNKSVYYVTLGGFNVISNAGPTMMMPMYTSAGTYVSYNPVFMNYNSYATTRSVYFNAIFDFNFNHVEGEFEDNVFDKIKSYQEGKNYLTAEDVFFHNDNVFFGSYNLKEATYNLIKF